MPSGSIAMNISISVSAGAFLHMQMISAPCTSKDTLKEQVAEKFVNNNALMLNTLKCEVVVISTGKAHSDLVCTMASHPLIPCESARCLGFWWTWN